MAVDANLASLFENLKVEDPWLPPRSWESIPSESGRPPPISSSSHPPPLFHASTVSVSTFLSHSVVTLGFLLSFPFFF